jgi:hypothetical protein
MKQSPYWEANSRSASQEILPKFYHVHMWIHSTPSHLICLRSLFSHSSCTSLPMSVMVFLGGRQPAWPGSLLFNNGNHGTIVGRNRCAAMGVVPLLEYVEQQWPRITLCNSDLWTLLTLLLAVTSEDSATMFYLMWHEEHLWDVSVLQRVYLSSLVILSSHLSLVLPSGLFISGQLHLVARLGGSEASEWQSGTLIFFQFVKFNVFFRTS